MKWVCAYCRGLFDEMPAIEHQHLFPGCGGSCGYQSRVCKTCAPQLGEHESRTKTFTRDHEIHHEKNPPRPDGEPQRYQLQLKRKEDEI